MLYNGDRRLRGEEDSGDRKYIRLSDQFESPSEGFEWTATMLNINAGHSRDIMAKSRVLTDYADFIEKIKQNHKSGMPIDQAVGKAIDECVEQGVLKEYLLKTKGEVLDMILTEYNEALHNKTLREEGFAEGESKGLDKGIELGKAEGIAIGRSEGAVSASVQIYKNMRKSGYNTEEAQQLTGLTDQQVKEVEEASAL